MVCFKTVLDSRYSGWTTERTVWVSIPDRVKRFSCCRKHPNLFYFSPPPAIGTDGQAAVE